MYIFALNIRIKSTYLAMCCCFFCTSHCAHMAACMLCASQCFPLMHEHGRVLYSQGDTCMRAHMHVGLLYESVLSV